MKLKWIDTVQIETVYDKDSRIAQNEIRVKMACSWRGNGLFLWGRIEDRGGKEADAIFPIPLEEDMSFCMRVTDPVLWNAENSYLYKIVVQVRDEDQEILDEYIAYVAYYKWEVIDGDNCLNGKKVTFRTRKLPIQCDNEVAMDDFLCTIKREFCNSVLASVDQLCPYLEQKCMEYGIYLIAPGKNLECGKIVAELEQNPGGFYASVNPDFSISVIKDGALIENHSTFVNTQEYFLGYEVRKGEVTVQKGKIHVDIPAGESRYVSLPYMELRDAGIFTYRVSLCLEKGNLWEEEGYEIACGENQISNLFL